MDSFFLGMQRSWILVFLLLGLSRQPALAGTLPGDKGDEPIPGFSNLVLEYLPDTTPSAIPCGRVLYPLRVSNYGPDASSLIHIHFNFQEANLVSTMGCLNSPLEEGFCDLEIIQAGDTREVTLIAMTDFGASAVVSFNGLVTGPNQDVHPENNVLSALTPVEPDSPPNLNILEPLDGTIISESDAEIGVALTAEVIDEVDDDVTLSQDIEWRSDRLVEVLGLGPSLIVPVEILGGHTIKATITDSCNNTVSDQVVIGIEPDEPVSLGEPIALDSIGEQGQPGIASLGDETFIVVWAEVDASDIEDNDGSIQAQRFDFGGVPIGEEVRVNSETDGLQHRPAVAGRPDGSFVVVWQSSPDSDLDSPEANILLRRFDSQGLPLDEQQVNISSDGRQLHPDVASHPDGSFLVAWESPSQVDPDGGVTARYFDISATGHEEFQVNSYTTETQGRPTLTVGPEGGFVAAWQSRGSVETDDDGFSIQLRRFNEALEPQGVETQVNRIIEGDQIVPAMDTNLGGQLVVVWKGSTATSDAQKRTLRIGGGTANSLGEWNEEDFDAFEPIISDPHNPFILSPPDVAISPDGDFVVIWANGLDSENTFSVQVRPFFGLENSPQPFGVPFTLDHSGLGLPTIAYSHSDALSTNFFAFWETQGGGDGSPPEGPMNVLDITGSRVSLPFPPLQADWSVESNGDPDPATEGGPLAFTIQAENLGPAEAVDVKVRLEPPSQWTFLSSADCEPPSSGVVVCELGTVRVGEIRSLALSGRVQLGAPASIEHRVEIISSTPGTTDEPVVILGSTNVVSAPEGTLFFDSFESSTTGAWSHSTSFAGDNKQHPQHEEW